MAYQDPVGVMRSPMTNPSYPPPSYDTSRQAISAQPITNQINIINASPAYVAPVVTTRVVQSYKFHIVYACCAFWCCFGLIGAIAFLLAVLAQSEAYNGTKARCLGSASIGLSTFAIIIGIVIYSIIIAAPYSSHSADDSLDYLGD